MLTGCLRDMFISQVQDSMDIYDVLMWFIRCCHLCTCPWKSDKQNSHEKFAHQVEVLKSNDVLKYKQHMRSKAMHWAWFKC